MEQGQPRRSDRHDDPGGSSRRGALLALLVVFLLLVGGVIAAGAYYGHCEGASGPKHDVAFTVEPGTSGEEVVSQLHDLGVLRCDGIVGRILLRGTGKADAIRAGSYTLTTNMTFDEACFVNLVSANLSLFGLFQEPLRGLAAGRLTLDEARGLHT